MVMSKSETVSSEYLPRLRQLSALDQADFYTLLVNSIQDYAIFLMDPKGIISSWNLGAQKLKGYTPEEIIGKHFSTFYGPEDIANDKPGTELKLCNRFGHVEDEGWRIKKDGGKFWANVVITALRDKNGKLVGYAKVTRDLTERKKHEDDLRSANERLLRQQVELADLNSVKDEFISLASHQLRTPATGVKQFLGLLLEGYAGELSSQQKDYLQRAYDSNDRQIDLVNDLLRVAQIDAGKIILAKSSTDIINLTKDVVDEQIDSFKDRQQSLHLELPSSPLHAYIDQMRFRMVLENIIDNASKYTPHGGKINVTIHSDVNRIYVKVADTGVGIDKESLAKLFMKFSRIPNELSEAVGGSGLGLYWAHKVMELHDGTIEVTSKPGEGTVFSIIFPKEAA